MRGMLPGRWVRAVVAALFFAGAAVARGAAPADSSLVDAVRSGNYDSVREQIARHADVNAPGEDGESPLAWAVHRDDLKMADALIRAGADVNRANDYGVTPLSLACTNRSGAMVERLLAAGANPNAAQLTGETPLMTCSATGTVDGVKALLARGAQVDAREKERGQTALMWAVAEKQTEVVRVLLEHGADVHARSRVFPFPEPFQQPSKNIFGSSYDDTVRFPKQTGGFTPLLFAAQKGDIEAAALLLAAGADVNERTEDEGTALIIASHSGHEKMALFLLSKGADPKAKDGWGITALHYALNKGLLTLAGMRRSPTNKFGWERPNMPELAKALLAAGADPNAKIEHDFPPYDYAPIARVNGNDHAQMSLVGVTPYLLAAASSDIDLMRVLVEARADPKIATPEGVNALLVCAGLGVERGINDEQMAIAAAKLALQLGSDVNAKKEDGRTALHAAAYLGWNDMIRLLVAKGADLEAKDMYGETPLSIALGDPEGLVYRQLPGGRYDDRFRNPREQKKTAELLLELGAKPFTGKYRDRSGE